MLVDNLFRSNRPLPLAAAAATLLAIGAITAPVHTALAADVPGSWTREFPRADFSRHTVDLAEIISGGPPRDGIPAIDDPKFVSSADAAQWLHADEPVIAVHGDGSGRAYPLQILMFHEIVNDEFAGTPMSVTFCPLCNASVVFDRRFGGEVLDFGTTGRLRMSDLVMYDRQSESWWQQMTGEAIVGKHAGSVLDRIPSQIVSFADFRGAYPSGRVLSRETGFSRAYGHNPYQGYDRVGQTPFLFRDPVDPRLPAMERVVTVSVGETHRVYPFSELRDGEVLHDVVAGVPVALFPSENLLSVLDRPRIVDSRTIKSVTVFGREVQGRVLEFDFGVDGPRDRQTGSLWNRAGVAVEGPFAGQRLPELDSGVHFAFAWLAFRPDSQVFRRDVEQ